MAEGRDEQRRTSVSVGIRSTTNVPAEPVVRLVADQLAEDGAGLPRAELDATDAVGTVATMPGCADGHVVDAVPLEIAGVADHAAVPLAWLAPRPVTKLLARLAGVDVDLTRKRPRLVLGRGSGHGDLALAVAVEIAELGDDAAEASPRIRSLPVVQLLAGCRRDDPDASHPLAVPVRRVGSADGEIGVPVTIQVVEPGHVPAEGSVLLCRLVGAQDAAILAAQQIHPTALLRWRTDEEIDAPVAIEVPCPRQIPAEILALGLHALPQLRAGLGRPSHHRTSCHAVHRSVRRRDDHVGGALAGEIRPEERPMPEEPIRPLAVPLADRRAGRAGPHRGDAVLLRAVLELEAGTGGDVGMAIAVGVERLAEAKSQLSILDAAGKAARQTPTGSRSRAGRRRIRRGREGSPGNLKRGEENRDGRDRESASPARACRRRRIPHRQQATQAFPEKLHCRPLCAASGFPVTGSRPARVPAELLRSTFSPRELVCAVAYSQLMPEPPTASSLHCWSGGAVESMAQKDVTMLAMSFRFTRSPSIVEVLSSSSEHACVPANFMSHMAFAPSSPGVPAKLNRPGVEGSAPFTKAPRSFGVFASSFAKHPFAGSFHH